MPCTIAGPGRDIISELITTNDLPIKITGHDRETAITALEVVDSNGDQVTGFNPQLVVLMQLCGYILPNLDVAPMHVHIYGDLADGPNLVQNEMLVTMINTGGVMRLANNGWNTM